MLTQELQALAAGGTAAKSNALVQRPVSPLVAQIDGDSWCADGRELQNYVATSSSAAGGVNAIVPADATASAVNTTVKNAAPQRVAWQLKESAFTYGCGLPNCSSFGYQARGKGMQMELQLDLNAVKTPSGTLNRRAIYVFFSEGAVYLEDGKELVGMGQLTCVSGCNCKPMLLDGLRDDGKASVDANSTEVSRLLRHTQSGACLFAH
jgi:hypothetical protein